MKLRPEEISSVIKGKIEGFGLAAQTTEEGYVLSTGDGIARVYGLDNCMSGELLEFANGEFGMAMNLEEENIGCVLLGENVDITEGSIVRRTGKTVEVPVGEAFVGRVISPLGVPIDGKGPIQAVTTRPVEFLAPGVIHRKSVNTPLQTGIMAIDSMIPIGRGQRELIIGDKQTGKTAIAVDTIINQKNTGVICIYVAIGQKASTVASMVETLERFNAMEHTIIVTSTASDSSTVQYIAPYAGCALAEYFMYDLHKDVLIVYDDLSKHAVAYRAMSLLLRRPPGREAYPGDVFYIHSRLLERAARVNEEYVEKFTKGKVKGKTGSLTALPIIETAAGDVSAFVPTNVISITDGQIFLETDLFNAGIRPAINAGISVSRVGGAAQTKVIKKLGGGVRLALAQYRELAAFAQFASDLDEATRKQLDRGRMFTELMKQAQYAPLSVSQMAVTLFAANKGYLDDVPTNKVLAFENALHGFMNSKYKKIMQDIEKTADLSGDNEKSLEKAIEDFKSSNAY